MKRSDHVVSIIIFLIWLWLTYYSATSLFDEYAIHDQSQVSYTTWTITNKRIWGKTDGSKYNIRYQFEINWQEYSYTDWTRKNIRTYIPRSDYTSLRIWSEIKIRYETNNPSNNSPQTSHMNWPNNWFPDSYVGLFFWILLLLIYIPWLPIAHRDFIKYINN